MWCGNQSVWRDACQTSRTCSFRCWNGLARCVVLAAVLTGLGSAAAWAQTTLVPSLTVAERYDTNVFFYSVGDNLVDYVTTITPSLLTEHKGRTLDASLTTTVMGEIYAENPGLNYIAPSGSASLDLTKLLRQFSRHASLTLTDSFAYTPQPPAFFAPGTGSAVSPEFVRGIQTIRARSISNIAAASGAYELTERSTFKAGFTHMYMRFGNVMTPTGVSGQLVPGVQSPFFTTTFSVLTAGPEIKVTPRDVFTLTFQRQQMDFAVNDIKFGFQTYGGLVGWKRKLSQEFEVSAAGGAAWLTPGDSLQYLANGALEWTHNATTGTLSYSRTIFPSFFIAAAPLISQNIGLTVIHRLAPNLIATGSAGYGLNETIPAEVARFEAYTASALLVYRFTRTWTASASYTHYEFVQGITGQQYQFDRDVMMISLKKEWK